MVATGGGIVVDPVNRAVMAAAGRVVLLHVPLEELARRLIAPSEHATRPLLGDNRELLYARLQELWSRRQSAYEEADVVVDAGGSPQDAVHALRAALEVRS